MKLIMSIMCSLLFTITTMAQTVEDVTLVTSGSASTEQEATLVALRSAIEQTFGTFVSSNTTMVNDELIKDEIVSVSKGNVKQYKKLSTNTLPNGQVSVSVEATISISKLISYAKSKGSQAEFAGQTFAMNMKLKELREKNTIAALKHMVDECIIVANDAFDFQVELGEPVVAKSRTYLMTLERSFAGVHEYSYHADDKSKPEDGYLIPLHIKILANSASSHIYDLFCNTINSLKLSDEEIVEYRKVGFRFSELGYGRFLNAYTLPISDRKVIENEINRLRRSLLYSAFRYRLIDTSNPQHNYKWYNMIYKNTRMRTISNTPSNTPETYPTRKAFEYNYKSGCSWFLTDSRDILSASVVGWSDGRLNFDEQSYNMSFSSMGGRGTRVFDWFDISDISKQSCFEKMQLPKSKQSDSHTQSSKKSKKKSNKKNKNLILYSEGGIGAQIGAFINSQSNSQSKVSNDEQRLILTCNTRIFIPKSEMTNFNGFTLELR